MQDDILRQEGEEIHAGYFHDHIRIVMHEYLSTKSGLIEVQKMVEHLNHRAAEKAHAEAEELAFEAGIKFDASKVVVQNESITKRHNIYEVFRKYDADGGGTLDPDELRVLLDELNIPMTDEELVELFEELDEDGEGGIDFDEFYTWFQREAENQRKKNKLSYIANTLTGGVFDGFAKLVMEVEARNLCMDHAVWTATRDARIEYRIAHPPRFLCDRPGSHCTESFATQDAFFAHRDDTEGHAEKDREREDELDRFHTVELFLAGPHGRMTLANRLLFSIDLASMHVRINSSVLTPFRPRTLDPENKREAQQLRGMMVQGYNPKAGVRAGYKRRGMRSQHLAPGRTAEQAMLQDVIAGLMTCRDDTIDVVSAPSTAAHAEVVFTWKGFAKRTIEITGNFTGWKKEPLSPYLQIPPPPEPVRSVEEEAKISKNNDNASLGSTSLDNAATKSLTFGRSSIIKHLGPGKYFYRYLIDGVEMLDDHATKAEDPVTHILSNILLVINPVTSEGSKHQKPTALSRMLPETGQVRAESGDDSSVMSVMTNGSKKKVITPKKGKYDDLVHVNNLQTEAAKDQKQAQLAGLKKVNLRNMSLFDDGVWAFASFMQANSFIQDLDLSFNSISDDGMQAVATILPRMKLLHTFKANGNSFGYDGLRYIMKPLKESKTILRLELSGNTIGDDGAELIGQDLLPTHPNLKALYLDENKIGDDGADQIAQGLLRNKVLETLCVSKNLIYNSGAQRLAFAIQSSGSLKYFRINDCPIGPVGGRHFGDMILMNDCLTYLDLSSIDLCRNDDRSGYGSIVAGIAKNKVMTHICLRNNKINDLMTIDLVQALLGNLSMDHVDLMSNNIPARWFKPDHYIETKISRKTPSVTTRLALIAKAKLDPDAKKYKGKVRDVDEEMDGKWTWRRKWKKIDRKAEERRAIALAGSKEDALIQLETEYCNEQLEKYLVSIAAFLENPNCQIFVTTIAKLIVQHMYELLQLLPEPPPRDLVKEEEERIAAIMLKLEQEQEKRKKEKEMSWQNKSKKKKDDDDDLEIPDADASGERKEGSPSKDANKSDGGDGREEMKAGASNGPIAFDDERFNHVHITVCKAIFLELGADYFSLMLPYEKTEQAFQLLAIPIHAQDLQDAVHEMQVVNQPRISFKKFLHYTKTHAKRIVKGNYFARMRVQADLFFRPPNDEAKQIIIDSFKYVAINDIRKNYRAQLEHPPRFACKVCHARFNSIKPYEKHMAKGENSIEHKRLETLSEIQESQNYFLRRSKWLVTNTFFPAFFELSPGTALPEDYIPQVFDSMGEEGRPIGVVDSNRVLLVEDVLGDFLQIAFEGRLGWVRYRLPHERPAWRRVLRPACEEVQYFSWKTLRVNSRPVYIQVRNDKELPKTFELKVRLEPILESEVVGYLKMGQVIETRASVGDWIQIRFEDQECAWIVKSVGGGHWRPPLTRAELKAIKRAEVEKQRKILEARREKIRAMKAAAGKKRSKKPVVYTFADEQDEVIPPGAYGAETTRILHKQVQDRLRKFVVESPYDPTEEDLDVWEEEEYPDDDGNNDNNSVVSSGSKSKKAASEDKDGETKV